MDDPHPSSAPSELPQSQSQPQSQVVLIHDGDAAPVDGDERPTVDEDEDRKAVASDDSGTPQQLELPSPRRWSRTSKEEHRPPLLTPLPPSASSLPSPPDSEAAESTTVPGFSGSAPRLPLPTTPSSPPPHGPHTSSVSSWLMQLRALLMKNGQSLWFDWPTSVLLLGLPVLLIGALALIAHVEQLTEAKGVSLAPRSFSFTRCQAQDVYGLSSQSSEPCISLAYAPVNSFTTAVMTSVCASVGLSFSDDVAGFVEKEAVVSQWLERPGYLDVAVVFAQSGDRWLSAGPQVGSLSRAYTLYHNVSSATAGYDNLLALQFVLETAIAQHAGQLVSSAFPNSLTPVQPAPQSMEPVLPSALQVQWVITPPTSNPNTATQQSGLDTAQNDDIIDHTAVPILTLLGSVFALIAVQVSRQMTVCSVRRSPAL
jgi:hypothetical protein